MGMWTREIYHTACPAPPCSIFPSLCPMADQVHLFNGVRYVPIKAIRDPDRKWLSAGWPSK